MADDPPRYNGVLIPEQVAGDTRAYLGPPPRGRSLAHVDLDRGDALDADTRREVDDVLRHYVGRKFHHNTLEDLRAEVSLAIARRTPLTVSAVQKMVRVSVLAGSRVLVHIDEPTLMARLRGGPSPPPWFGRDIDADDVEFRQQVGEWFLEPHEPRGNDGHDPDGRRRRTTCSTCGAEPWMDCDTVVHSGIRVRQQVGAMLGVVRDLAARRVRLDVTTTGPRADHRRPGWVRGNPPGSLTPTLVPVAVFTVVGEQGEPIKMPDLGERSSLQPAEIIDDVMRAIADGFDVDAETCERAMLFWGELAQKKAGGQ